MAISCFAVGAHLAYIYVREEFPEAAKILKLAIWEAHQRRPFAWKFAKAIEGKQKW
jgi:NADH:ubiquinone oxidoreductase subunit F (NADH-binding)